MTIFMNASTAQSEGFRRPVIDDVVITWEGGEVVMTPSVLAEDPLENRFAAIVRLRHGWDGPNSLAPAPQALRVLYKSALQLTLGRARINPSPHPDGYINVEWNAGRVIFSVELYPDRADYMIHDLDSGEFSESFGSLDVDELTAFLRSSDSVD